MPTKGDVLLSSFSDLRISGLTVSADDESLSKGLSKLERFMEYLYGMDINLGYNFEEIPDLSTEIGTSSKFRLMIETNIAVLLIPSFNKSVPSELKAQASALLSNAITLAGASNMREVPYPDRQPIGAANSLRYYSFQKFYPPINAFPVSSSIIFMHTGEVNYFFESFSDYLKNNETITSYTIVSDLQLTNESNTDTVVYYTLTAGTAVNDYDVIVTATTSEGRIETRKRIARISA